MNRDYIVNLARGFVDTPYHHHGRLPGEGLDCAGVLVAVANIIGYPCVDLVDGYSRFPDGLQLLEKLGESWDEIPVQIAKEADILVFWIDPRLKIPQHIGIKTHIQTTGMEGMVHATQIIPKVVEHHLDERWMKRICNAFTWRGMA